MNGVHDMGGMHGFGEVEPEPDEPPFHAPWEGRVLAMQRALRFTRAWNIDRSRDAQERLPAPVYLSASYYRRWALGMERNALEGELIDADEIVHELQRPGTAVFAGIVARFGPDLVGSDGTLDRAALRRRALASPADLAALNAIVHPAVWKRSAELVEQAMQRLLRAHADVGGDVVSAGGTCTYALNTWASEIQAGSYALMDSAYTYEDLPFRPALWVHAAVISVSAGWAVANAGLKSLAMDHGNPGIDGARVLFCSDEHVTFDPGSIGPFRPGDHVRLLPAHVDPTMAMHEQAYLVDGDDVLEVWPIDLRGW